MSTFWRKFGQPVELVLLIGVVLIFWEGQVFTPLRILVVFFHEGSHALVAWLTGGQVRELVVNAREGGHVLAAGGNRFLTLNAGYLGEGLNDFLLRLIGLTSMVYVPHDIYNDTIARSSLLSDARMLANEYGGPTVLWGAAWLAASVVLILSCLISSVKSGAGRIEA